MDFIKYLQFAKEATKNINSFKDIHIVIGNESCDMDSTVSSLIFAYFLNKHKIPEIDDSALVIPILNVSYENFLLRSDNCFVLQECGISLNFLIYRDQLDFEEILKTNKLTTTLVDHHILAATEKSLENTVIQIFDHRPVDPSNNWSNKKIDLNIKQVGSCSTLIADKILEVDELFLNKELAYLIYETIVYDTVALLPENGRAKELDLIIAKKLEEKFSFKEERKVVFEKLWAAHNDISHLTPTQILSKDLKIVENTPVPGLPMLVESFLKLDDAYTAIEKFAEKYKVSLLVLIGLDANREVKRDIGIFWKNGSKDLKDILLSKLKCSEDLKGYSFCLTEVCTGYKDIICLRQNNTKLSRKQIIPLIKDAILENVNI
ncbi:hypothetical protein NQ314_009585 [Rhamnusium bicolor]|uniref:DHHA2 domain-containing protein n=1 Tax=Rhamnusium bicolor TaxID=1586634 RepID=A0AAV8XYA8_9CUCU|nr:hypothetical protein NQ314_009585 [Rhamnusium bicolor]